MPTNLEMERMLRSLEPHLSRKDVVGYAAARNTRILGTELIEFEGMRDELVLEYGEEDVGDDGEPTGQVTLRADSPGFPVFAERMGPICAIEHDPPIYTIPYEEVKGLLTGAEILEIDWMLKGGS